MRWLFLAFIIVPVLEMWLLIELGQVIGAIPTILLVVATAAIGIHLLQHQGLQTLGRIQEKLNSGQPPALELLEGLALMVGGALLLTPGFVTDTVGFLCLLPQTRRLLMVKLFQRLLSSATVVSSFSHHAGGWSTGYRPDGNQPGGTSDNNGNHDGPRVIYRDREGHDVIEGECRREKD